MFGVFCFKTNSKTDPLGFKKTLALFLCFTIRAKTQHHETPPACAPGNRAAWGL
jgi:hypothetical protein